MRYAIDLIDAIALADGTRRLREVLQDNRLPNDAILTTETQLTEILSEFLSPEDVQAVIKAVKTTGRY